MGSWQLNSSVRRQPLTTLLSVEFFPTKSSHRHLFPFTPTSVLCFSSRGILSSNSMSSSWLARSLRRSNLVEFFSVVIMLDEGLEGEDANINSSNESTSPRRAIGSWRFVSPLSSYLTSWISGRDSCLVGVSCHSPRICFPRICLPLVSLKQPCIMFIFQLKMKWGWQTLAPKLNQIGST